MYSPYNKHLFSRAENLPLKKSHLELRFPAAPVLKLR